VARALGTGQVLTTTWTVTPAADARWGSHDLTATVTHDRAPAVADTVPVQVKAAPGTVSAPYRTAATTDATYAQAGDQFAIWAGGADLSGWKDEKGIICRDGPGGEKATVQATLVSQTGSTPVGKAGIAIANDLAAPEKGGYAVLVMTRDYGLEFLTDSNGDGTLDTWAGGGASYHPAHLKLVRDGTGYTAYASTDADTWTRIGAAEVPSAAGTGTAGMVASAVNANYPDATIEAVFSGFSVTN
jgi:hypothetical protein